MSQLGSYLQIGGGFTQTGGGVFQQPHVYGGGLCMPTTGGMLGYTAQPQSGGIGFWTGMPTMGGMLGYKFLAQPQQGGICFGGGSAPPPGQGYWGAPDYGNPPAGNAGAPPPQTAMLSQPSQQLYQLCMPTTGGMPGFPAQPQPGGTGFWNTPPKNTPESKTDGSAVSPSLSLEQIVRTEKLLFFMEIDWKTAFEEEFYKDYFQKLTKFVEEERVEWTVYPPADQVFSWTQYCTLDSVKVVILGQDPYPRPGQAHGLCFSVPNGVECPPSLKNIYTELKGDIKGFQDPGHGNLIGWAKQGVLLLNSCLTVRHKKPKSHKGQGWEKFTDAVISWLNENKTELVFILWGEDAQEKAAPKKASIDKEKHCVLTAAHPSPRSADRGFFGCKHFSKCNAYLEEKGKTPIDWTLLPPQGVPTGLDTFLKIVFIALASLIKASTDF